jgi:hypothetical protein
MMGLLDKMNLRPGERRLVVVSVLVLFLVINWMFVWPKFNDYAAETARLAKNNEKLQVFRKEIAQGQIYRDKLAKFAKDNPDIPMDEQSLQFLRTIQNKASESGVNLTTVNRANTKTNDFFVEQSQTIGVSATEAQLVNFLNLLGVGESLVRVRALTLRPDQPHYRLAGSITLVASFQRKKMASTPAARPVASAAATTAAPSARTNAPAATTASAATTPAPASRVRTPTNTPAAGPAAAALRARTNTAGAPAVRIPGRTPNSPVSPPVSGPRRGTNNPPPGIPRPSAPPPGAP